LYIWSFIFLYWIQSGNLSFLYYVRTVTENDPQGVDFSWTFHLSRLLTQKANAVSYLPVFFVYVILCLNSRPGVSFPKASAKVRRLYQTTKYFNNFFWTFSALPLQNTLFCPLAQLLTPTKIFYLFLLDSRRILQNLPFILLFWQCFLFIRNADFICAFEEKQATGDVFFNKTCVLHEIHFRDF